MKEQSADTHIPQCPECGLPMNIARIVSALPADSGQTADNYVYECVQGHELVKRVERNARSRVRNIHTAALEMKTALLRLLPNRTRPDDYLVMSGDVRVGRIYKRPAAYRGLEWRWAINRPYAEWLDLQLAGRTASLEQAKSELTENWNKVLSAELTKRR
jgi:hypothetical protein